MNDNRIYPQFRKPFLENDIFDTTYLYKRHLYIEDVLDQDDLLYAYLEEINEESLAVNIGNALSLPVEIVEIKIKRLYNCQK